MRKKIAISTVAQLIGLLIFKIAMLIFPDGILGIDTYYFAFVQGACVALTVQTAIREWNSKPN